MKRGHFTDGHTEYYFERRKYGSGPSTQFYTWLMYRVEAAGKEWDTYGDPWPSSVIPKRELAEALADIRSKNPIREMTAS